MKKLLILTFFCLFWGFAAQSKSRADSLRAVLAGLSVQKKSFTLDTSLINLYCQLGKEFTKVKDDSALYYLNKALVIAQRIDNKELLLKTYIQTATHYGIQFGHIKALEYWYKALALAEELKDNKRSIFILGRIAVSFSSMHDFKTSLEYYKKRAELSKAVNDQQEYVMSLMNIGNINFDMADYKTALKYYQLCEQLNKSVKSKKIESSAIINIAMTRVKFKQYEEALAGFKASLEVDEGYDDKIAFVNNEIAKVYLLLNKPKEALKYATIAQNNVKHVYAKMNMDVSRTLSEIYEKIGNDVLAYKYYKDYVNVRLSEDSTKNSQLMRLVQLDYETEKNNQKLAQLNLRVQERENRTRLMSIGLGALLVLILVALGYSRSLAQKNKLIEAQKAAIQKLNESLEVKVEERTRELTVANEGLKQKNKEIREALLKGQTMERERVASELHDNIGGTLTALKWRFEALDKDNLSEKEQVIYDGILKNMHRAYGEVRLISHNMLPAEFEEKGLVGALEKFIADLNTGAAKTNFRLNVSQLQKPIRQEVALEIYICCFEIINNVIKHANATEVELEIAEKQNGNLEVMILDNGKGFDPAVIGNGKGLKNIMNRAEKVNGSLIINSKLNVGSQFCISIPELFWEEILAV
ncbi:histidine kinase [Emticicia sp. TH156]|uniref:tetratricopeptide repeat-containing sensor histidine kinase n=1 Tax=Emticicia sp. TH156 TaxID=2067454 RepID=UPI000C7870A1|nr:histidine kinase [Emticicia sp. TH156]PLK43198.1 hypothetical protein C0V77_17650 [Emticicia sp. TH156]